MCDSWGALGPQCVLVEEGAPAIGQSHGGIPDRGQLEIGRNLVARANFGVAEERSQRARTRR